MASTHRAPSRSKSKSNTIVATEDFWQSLREPVYTVEELRSKGYRSTTDLIELAGICRSSVERWAKQRGLVRHRLKTFYVGGIRTMAWYGPPDNSGQQIKSSL